MSEIKYDGILDISIEEYHKSVGVSRSGLMELNKSPKHYWYKYINPDYVQPEMALIIRKTNSLEFGNALHEYVLEKKKFHDNYVICPKISRATKAGKMTFMKIQEEAEKLNKKILCEEALEEIVEMTESIYSHRDPEGVCAGDLIEGAAYEKSIYWKDKETGLTCKARPDIWHDNMIVDLKTCQDASYNAFQRSVVKFGYHLQAGMIQEGLEVAIEKHIDNFLFIAVEKEPPYAVGVYSLDENAIDVGITWFKHLLAQLESNFKTQDWQSYGTYELSLPSYLTDMNDE